MMEWYMIVGVYAFASPDRPIPAFVPTIYTPSIFLRFPSTVTIMNYDSDSGAMCYINLNRMNF
jgi:hypothetical protein